MINIVVTCDCSIMSSDTGLKVAEIMGSDQGKNLIPITKLFGKALLFCKNVGDRRCHMRFGNLMHFGPGIQMHGNFGYAKSYPRT